MRRIPTVCERPLDDENDKNSRSECVVYIYVYICLLYAHKAEDERKHNNRRMCEAKYL